MFKQGNTYGTGRPLGAQNKAPNRDKLISLLNRIVDEVSADYNQLNRDEKLNIIRTFKHLYTTYDFEQPEIENNTIRVEIVKPTP
jgi:hypothetical protein